jgi:hypothetical protein
MESNSQSLAKYYDRIISKKWDSFGTLTFKKALRTLLEEIETSL